MANPRKHKGTCDSWQVSQQRKQTNPIISAVQARGGSWPRTTGQITNWRSRSAGWSPGLSRLALKSLRLSCLTLKSVSGEGGWACAQPASGRQPGAQRDKGNGAGLPPQRELRKTPAPKQSLWPLKSHLKLSPCAEPVFATRWEENSHLG